MNIFPLGFASRGSFKRQIILTFVFGFFSLLTAFSVYITNLEKASLYDDVRQDTAIVAEVLAAGSRSWVLANDVVGLQEVVLSFKNHSELSYAMVLNHADRVLAHTDSTKVGQFVADERSLALLKGAPVTRVMVNEARAIDVAVPIMAGNQHVGWVWVEQSLEAANGTLRGMIWNRVIFVLVSTILAMIAALLIARRLGGRIDALVATSDQVQAGNFDTRVNIRGSDELTKLAGSFNRMLDALAQNKEELQTASRYTRSLIEASLDPLVTVSPEGKITDVNDATIKATGVDREQLIGTDFSGYFTEPDKAREGYQQVFASGFVTDYPLTIRHRDGRLMDVLYNASVYKDANGKVLGVLAAARDVTVRKQAEKELREKEERLALATLHNGIGIWDWNLQTQEMIWDDSMYALYHIRREDFSGTEEAWRKSLHPDDLERGDRDVADAISGKKPFDTEFRVVWPNGEVRHIKAVARVFRDERGTPLRMLGTNMDITDRKRAEEAVRQMNIELERRVEERTASLEAANKELESFSYSVSHDLRTPLRAIDGFSNILLEDYADKLDDEGKRLLNVVRNNTVRMGQLIDDILQFSRTGRLALQASRVDMELLAHDVLNDLQTSNPDIKAQVKIGPLPQTWGDLAMLRQVLVNLLSNAIKFSRANPAPSVEVGGVTKGDETVYFVRDNGVGFDMQYVDKLFGVFQRLHSVTEFEGTGIGLAIVKRIVTRHGGRVWAEGKLNEGATIYFALPAKEK